MAQFNELAISGKGTEAGLRLFSPDDSVSILTPVVTTDVPPPTQSAASKAPRKQRGIGKKDRNLWLHPTGRWCIRVAGKAWYFGKDKEAAETEWNRVKNDILNGRDPVPVPVAGVKTLADLCNAYLTEKRDLLNNGELSPRTYKDCKRVTDRLVTVFNRERPAASISIEDFRTLRSHMAKTLAKLALSIEIQRTKAVFTFGAENEILDHEPSYGTAFKKPKTKYIRGERNKQEEAGKKMFEAAEIQKQLAAASPAMKAMILLGINCGLGNRDLALLPISAVDLKTGWHNFPRPKTAVPRRCPLWKETVIAIKEYLKVRPKPRSEEEAPLLFLTKFGACWCRYNDKTTDAEQPDGTWIDSIGLGFGKLLRKLEMKRPGLNFYALRHTFRTKAGATRDREACDSIMGHVPDSDDMAARYTHDIDDARLKAVVESVHLWLYGKSAKQR